MQPEGEHWWFHAEQYLPGYTRGDFSFLWNDDRAGRVLRFMAECYAAKMIDSSNKREDCLLRALAWLEDKKGGRPIVTKLGDLEAALQTKDLHERNRWANEAEKALGMRNERVGVVHSVLSGVAHVGAQAAAAVLGDPVKGMNFGLQGLRELGGRSHVPGNFRWMLAIPEKDRTAISKKTQDLIERS